MAEISARKYNVYFTLRDVSPLRSPCRYLESPSKSVPTPSPGLSSVLPPCEAAFGQASQKERLSPPFSLLLPPCPPRRGAWARARLAGGRDIWLHANGHPASAARLETGACQRYADLLPGEWTGWEEGWGGDGEGLWQQRCCCRRWPSSWKPPHLSRHREAPRVVFLKLFFQADVSRHLGNAAPLFLRALRSVQGIQAEMDHEGFATCG